MNTYQSNTYGKDLTWLHFSNVPRVQERQKEKDQQYYSECVKTGRNDSKFTIGKYHINTMKVISSKYLYASNKVALSLVT